MQFSDAEGAPYASGELFFFETGTSTPKDTFTTPELTVANSNPIALDSEGRPSNGGGTPVDVWGDGEFKLVVKSGGSTVGTYDPVLGFDLVGALSKNTIADMTAILKSTLSDDVVVNVSGYYAVADGGGGGFAFDSASTATANGGTIIATDEGGAGRWNRIIDNYVTLRMFGAKLDFNTTTFTGTDDTARIQAAWNFAGTTQTKIIEPDGDTKIVGNPALQIDSDWINFKYDFGATSFHYDDGAGNGGTGVAIEVGGIGAVAKLFEADMVNMRVFRRVAAGSFESTLLGTGIKIVSMLECRMDNPRVQGFRKGVSFEPSTSGEAVSVNTFVNLVTQNCFDSIFMEPDASSTNCFVTSNKFYGGYLNLDKAGFSNVATSDSALIKMLNPGRGLSANTIDGNTWNGMTLENFATRKIKCDGNSNQWVNCYFDAGTYNVGNSHASGSFPYRQSGITGFVSTAASDVITKAGHGLQSFVTVGDAIFIIVSSADISDLGYYVVTAIDANTITLNKAIASAATLTIEHFSTNIEFTENGNNNEIIGCDTAGIQIISSVSTVEDNSVTGGHMGMTKGQMPPRGTRGVDTVPWGLQDTPSPTLFSLADTVVTGAGTMNAYLGNMNDQDSDANIQLTFFALDGLDRQSDFASIMANKEGRTNSQAFGGIKIRTRSTGSNTYLVDAFEVDSNQNVTAGLGAHAPAATKGHFYIPSSNGAPTGTPDTKSGFVPIIFDAAGNQIYVFDAGAWIKTAALT